MRVFLANPAGLWALLSIPVILLIHFLQERSRRVRVSTLFLLERVKPESVAGARIERLRNSVPLWLQLAAALLITWMLAEPRWIRPDSRQTVAVVLDSSVSMSAFREETRAVLQRRLREWSRAAAHTEWHLLESDPRRPTLYAGESADQLLKAFDSWQPTRGTLRPDDVLLIARGLVKTNGIVIFVTDRKTDVPSDVAVLSAGEPLENAGFAGSEVTLAGRATPTSPAATKWTALVRNYGEKPASREWWVEYVDAAGQIIHTSGRQRVDLARGQSVNIAGELPPDVERAAIVLEADKFTWDDRLPIQKPHERLVRVEVRVSGPAGDLWRKLLGALENVDVAGTLPAPDAATPLPDPSAPPAPVAAPRAPDLVVSEFGTALDGPGIQIHLDEEGDNPLDGTWTVAEDHPLVRDVNWMGLLTARPTDLAVADNDEPLLWKGDRPLALVRRNISADGHVQRRLLLAWDVARSNASRHPAMLILVHRFVDEIRQQMREPWAGNFEAGQALAMPVPAGAQSAPVTLAHAGRDSRYAGRLPDAVGFFELKETGEPGGKPARTLVSGSLQFADTREADFHDAAALDTVEQRRWEAALKQTEADPLTALWLLLALGCLVTAWGWRQLGRPRAAQPRTRATASAASARPA